MIKPVRPTLLLNEAICKANIRGIAEKAVKSNVIFRPHFKTHQSHEVGRWFREEGITLCTVSSVKMAAYFAEDGWNDITVAFPLNVLESEEINRLASSIKLNLCLVSAEAVKELSKRLKHPVGCFIEIDPGYHRTGLDPANYSGIDEILTSISANPLLTFHGFLCHSGQSYAVRSVPAIMKVYNDTLSLMSGLDKHYRRQFPNLVLSIGDTPTCAVAPDFNGVNEVRPGNMVFYDIMQVMIGSCTKEQIAIAMACPVVAFNEERQEIFVHGGGVHFSKDFLKRDDGATTFGDVVKLTDNGWDTTALPMYVKSLSQEHGVIHASIEEIRKLKVGDLLGVLPVHSCLTADAIGKYTTLGGKVIEMMR